MTKPKVLIVFPDIFREFKTAKYPIQALYPNYGMNSLAIVLRNQGYYTKVIDSLYSFALSQNTNILSFIKSNIHTLNFDIVGISVLSPFRKIAVDIAKFVRKTNPHTKIIFGGPHVSLLGPDILKRYSNLIDALVLGEGEETLPKLIQAFEDKRDFSTVRGIAYINGSNKIKMTPPRPEITELDEIPLPNYDQYAEVLPDGKIPTISIITSRGCPYNCNFCSSKKLWKKVRNRSPENILKEIECLVEKYKVDEIRIWDDIFGINKKQAIAVFKSIVSRKINIRIGYLNTRIDVIDEEFLYWYKKAGGKGIFYGLESGSENVRKHMNKNFTNEKVIEISKATKKYGLLLGFFLIFGYPGETISDIRMTYRLLEEIKPDQIVYNLALIYPRTKLFEKAKEEGKVKIENWLDESPAFFPYTNSELAKGCMALFDQTFNKNLFRTEFENVTYNYFNSSLEKKKRLADKAKKILFG
jgi:radical SAM superfamily enzyme YgiQ (UPF0313 family)